MIKLAIYDMDKTITRVATFGPLLRFLLIRNPWRAGLIPLVALASVAFLLHLIDRKRLKELNLALLGGRRFDPRALGEAFGAQILASAIYPDAMRQIEADRAEGCQLVLASASYAFYVETIARNLGFDHVVATRSVVGNPARIDGQNCYGLAKRAMVESWMAGQGIARPQAEIRFYSDHVSDAPMFEMADKAITVNAHAALAMLAAEKDWEVRRWA
jgi:HAD superfamily hydrolase (TIGR01490 family)